MRSPRLTVLAAALAPLVFLAGCSVTDDGGDSTSSSATAGGDTDSASSSAPGDDAVATSIAPHGDVEDLAIAMAPASVPLPPDTDSATATAPASPSTTSIEVPGVTFGGKPIAESDLPFSVAETEIKQIDKGSGKAATAEQDVEVRYVLVNGTTGAEITSTFPTDETVVMPLANPALLPGLVKALTGAKPGASMIVAMPPADAFGESGYPDRGINPADTVIAYVEVVSATTPLTKAEGDAVAPVPGLPTVVADGTSPAQITIPAGKEPPTNLVVQPLIKGKGKTVESGDTITVQYTGVKWSDGSQFDSSLKEGGQPLQTVIGMGQVIPAWDEGLVGQTVGSRVLLVAPPNTAYGSAPDGSPQAALKTETLVFVVDILATS